MGAYIFNRLNGDLVQQLPTLTNINIDNKYKYVLPYPDQFDIKQDPALTSAPFLIGQAFDAQYPQYGNRVTNNLDSEADFDGAFDPDLRFPNVLANEFLDSSYMVGDVPNTTCITGRYPRVTRGELISSNLSASGNHCLVTQEIDIEGSTSDGLGRASFMLYWCDGQRRYIKDSTNLARTSSSLQGANVTGESNLTVLEEAPFLRSFISADNGASYTEVTNLTPITFPDRKARVRIAWVNPSNIDTHLLTYTLMY